jgi:hypothetical protein
LLAGFVLNATLRVSIADPIRQLMFSFMRRVDAAVLEYTRGRGALKEFIDSKPDVGISRYSRCLHAFETAVATTYQALLLIRQVVPTAPPLFKKADGTVLYHLDRVHNAIKHADHMIAHGERYAPGSTLPVWITNDGLESVDSLLRFDELADEIEALYRIAAHLASLDPPPENPTQKSSATGA